MAEKRCFDCGKVLKSTGSGPGWMNINQWEAQKAGDYFSPCETPTHPNGNCYFNDTQSVETLKPNAPKLALNK